MPGHVMRRTPRLVLATSPSYALLPSTWPRREAAARRKTRNRFKRNSQSVQEKLPLYLGFFEFVHNVRKRDKALPGAGGAADEAQGRGAGSHDSRAGRRRTTVVRRPVHGMRRDRR